MIETALALLAIGLGLLGVFGLGSMALNANRESNNEARCTLLADALFETLRDTNARFVDEARSNLVADAWHTLWVKAVTTADTIPFPPVAGMASSRPNLTGDPLYLRFQNLAPAFFMDNLSLNEWNPRYELMLLGADYGNSRVARHANILRFLLVVYPDGDTYSSERRLFYTTVTNTGGPL